MIETDRNRSRMTLQPSERPRARSRPGRAPAELSCAAFQDRGSLHEVKYAKARREAGGARRRQHVIGAADIIADGLGRMAAEEDGPGIADLGGEFIRVLGLDFEMLGRQPVDQRNGRFKRLDQDDRAVIAPACTGDLGLRQGPQADARPPSRPRRREPRRR